MKLKGQKKSSRCPESTGGRSETLNPNLANGPIKVCEAIFPCIPKHLKNDTGSEILESNSLSYQIANKVKSTHLDLVLFGDLALDPYTTHGHDGIIDPSGNVLNDETVEILAQAATLAASSGYDFVAPSDMMDGRVSVIVENPG